MFQDFRKTLEGADSISLALKSQEFGADGKPMRSLSGTLEILKPQSFRLRMEGTKEGKPVREGVVCDGTSMMLNQNKNYLPMPEDYGFKQRRFLAQAGWRAGTSLAPVRKNDCPAKDFKPLRIEKLGLAEAKVIEYALDAGDPGVQLQTTLWLDSKTLLPLKRHFRYETETELITVVESYDSFKINPKLDPKIFKLP